MPARSFVVWFSQISANDGPVVGDKGVHLGEMTRMGLPVPNGFVVTSQAYLDFLSRTGLDTKISHILHDLEVDNSEKLLKAAHEIGEMITKAEWPEDISQDIIKAYHQLSSKDVFVAVRSSVVVENAAHSHFFHSQAAKLNVHGRQAVLDSVKQMWASLFSARAILYRADHRMSHLSTSMAVQIQRMVEAESAGLAFSNDPITNSPSTITIEAIWGLGEALSESELVPDHYQVDKQSGEITNRQIVRQEWQLIKTTKQTDQQHGQNGSARLPVSAEWQRKQKLPDRFIQELAQLATKLENYFGEAQEVEWAFAEQTIFLTQTKSMSTVSAPELVGQPAQVVPATSTSSLTATGPHKLPLLVGQPLNPGTAHGTVKIIRSASGLSKVKAGEIVVAEDAAEWSGEELYEAAGIIIDRAEASDQIVSAAKGMGIPVVAGASNATTMLKAGETVTVDGYSGRIYEGKISIIEPKAISNLVIQQPVEPESHLLPRTATKIYLNASEPEQAEELAAKHSDGVGLLRAEYMLTKIGEHPQHLVAKKKEDVIVDALYEGIMAFAKAFDPRPVMYRFSDLTADGYRRLNGGEKFEEQETNPLIGYRGAVRYLAEPDVFRLEVQAVKRVRQYHKNVWAMVPFVRTPDELVQIKQLMAHEGLYRGGSFKLWMMAEVPANVLLLDQFIGVGIDGISVGTNDLCQLVLGIDRDNPKVAALFDERNEAVLGCLETIIRGAGRHGIMSSVCGQAPSVYPEVTKKLVEWGVSSVSVSPEVLTTTWETVADAEFELVRSGGRTK